MHSQKMKKPYFVMLRHPNGEFILPLVDEANEIIQFGSRSDAITGAESSSLGNEVGYEVFHFGNRGVL